MVPFNDDIGLQETLAHFNANLPLEEAFTPPASWYISDRILELEKVTTFSTSWLFVGRAAQVRHSGDYFTGSFLGRPFVVTRDEAGPTTSILQRLQPSCSLRSQGRRNGSKTRLSLSWLDL